VNDASDNPKPTAGPMSAVSPELLGQLWDRHAAALELFARQWCHAPEDVVQQAFVQLATQRVVPEQVAAWLYRVVRNGALSAARAEGRRRRHETAAAELAEPWLAAPEGSRLDAAAAAAALAELPLEEREVIVAHLWGGLTFQEIATVAETSSATAHRRYLSGLQTLRAKLTNAEQQRQ
jgi:RNA polymerase sigma-70 factor (ECF subfamily)